MKRKLKCDLHLHSNVSDGDFSIDFVLQREKNLGLDVVALTDHDTVDGVAYALSRGKELGLKVLPGVELSTMSDREVHVLGYNVAYLDEAFKKELKNLRELRGRRNALMLQKLANLGMPVTEEEVAAFATGTTTGRSHIAKAMVAKGYVASVNQAFDEFLGFGKKAYVKERRISPEDGVKLILRFGGTPVLAHPYSLNMDEAEVDEFVGGLVKVGLKGIESEYFSHTSEDKEKFGRIAQKYGLIRTGGSDFHREHVDDDAKPKFACFDDFCLKELKIEP